MSGRRVLVDLANQAAELREFANKAPDTGEEEDQKKKKKLRKKGVEGARTARERRGRKDDDERGREG